MAPHYAGQGWKLVLLAASCAAIASNDQALAATPQQRFQQHLQLVEGHVFRGRTLDETSLTDLKSRGIKTVINLRSSARKANLEMDIARRVGINEIWIPISGATGPRNEDLKRFFDVIQDSSLAPIYLHCEDGVDRTGMMVALYREKFDRWSADQAYREMLASGFHRSFWWMKNRVYDFDPATGSLKRPGLKTKLVRLGTMILWSPITVFDLVRTM